MRAILLYLLGYPKEYERLYRMRHKPSRDIPKASRQPNTLSPTELRRWIGEHRTRKTSFSIAGGILAIAAACACLFVGVVGITNFASMLARDYYSTSYPRDTLLLMGILSLAGFTFGLAGGIFSLQRIHFAAAMLGISSIMISGVVDFVASAPYDALNLWIGQWFGIPKFILSILSLLLVAVSKADST